MSTLKVTNIESPSGGGVNAKITDINGGQLSNRNLVINGAMQVSQRATQVTGVTTSGYRTCDRFTLAVGTLGTWTVDQSTDAPDGFSNSFKVTCTTADASPAAADVLAFIHRIEAQNLSRLKFGTSAAESLTLSFYVKSNKTGAASVDMYQPDASNRQISKSYTINSANTWEYKTITFPGDTAGGISNDNGIGLIIDFWLNSGSDYSSGSHQTTWGALDQTSRNASNLGVGGSLSDNFAITGIQLEVGEVATAFEHRSFSDELAKCQRYYEIARCVGWPRSSDNVIIGSISYKTEKRATPTSLSQTKVTGGGSGTVTTFNSSIYSVGVYQTGAAASSDCTYQVRADAEL